MKKIICEICHRLISKSNLSKHLRGHEKHPEWYLHKTQSVQHDGLNCVYCDKLCKNKNSLAQHECRCNKNPNKIVVINTGHSHTAWNKGLTKETDERVARGGQKLSKRIQSGEVIPSQLGKPITNEVKLKISKSCLEKSKNGNWHKSLAKNMHYNYNGIDLDGSWELNYAKWLDANNIKWERPSIRFTYKFKDKVHYYTPDFYLIETNEYVEVKGYKTAKDEVKWRDFPKEQKLKILFEKDLKELGVIS